MSLALIDICPRCYQTGGDHEPDCEFTDGTYAEALATVREEFNKLLHGLLSEIARLRAIVGTEQGEVSPDATVHRLKTHPREFMALAVGIKTFEFRKNDRNFQPGDVLLLQEYEPERETYTGRELTLLTPYVLSGPDFGVPDGYCVLSVVPTAEEARKHESSDHEIGRNLS
jgi:hypothetical protein